MKTKLIIHCTAITVDNQGIPLYKEVILEEDATEPTKASTVRDLFNGFTLELAQNRPPIEVKLIALNSIIRLEQDYEMEPTDRRIITPIETGIVTPGGKR